MYFEVFHSPEFNGPASGFRDKMYISGQSLEIIKQCCFTWFGDEFVAGIDKKPVLNWRIKQLSNQQWVDKPNTWKNINGYLIPVKEMEIEHDC